MPLPGIANVLGVAAWLTYRFLDPKAKKARLLDAKEKILKNPPLSGANALKLANIEHELLQVGRDIERG